MTDQVKVHETNIHIVQVSHTEIDAGAELALRVRVSCSDFCDLRGHIVKINAPDGSISEIVLTGFNGAENVADDFIVQVPNQAGLHTWTVTFPAQDKGAISHEESVVPSTFEFKPHAISLALWDLPSPILVGTAFRVKVRATCSAACALTNQSIDIVDQGGRRVATAQLGKDHWPGTDALYWSEVALQAPDAEGYYEWTVEFPEPDRDSPHDIVSQTFAFRTAMPPEHWVTVEVVDEDTQTPIQNAHVVLHPYWGDTDEHGMAKVGVAKGRYQVCVSAGGKKPFRAPVIVAGDKELRAELVAVPEDPG